MKRHQFKLAFFLALSICISIRGMCGTSDQPEVTISFQDGISPTAAYDGTADVGIAGQWGHQKTTNNEGGNISFGPYKSTLVKWDISEIPSNALITSAEITFFTSQSSPDEFEIYEIKKDWVASEATWLQAKSGSNWETEGVTGATDRGNTVLGLINPVNHWAHQTYTLNTEGVAVIQKWVDGTSDNNGFIIQDYTTSDWGQFHHEANATLNHHPKLTITYVTSFSLTVNNGSGSGNYEKDEIVSIEANTPDLGKEFDAWTGDIGNIADVNAANTTITMPASNTEITATYKDCTGPDAPTGLNAIRGDDEVTLQWNTVPGVDGYSIKYGTSQGGSYDLGPIALNDGATDEHVITGLTNGTTYYFVITAIKGTCESANSDEVQETPSVTIVEFAGTNFAISTEESGKNLGTVTETKIPGQPSSTTGFNVYTPILFVLDISTTGADDNLDACITFSYDDSDLPEEMRENTLVLFRYNEIDKKWEMIGGTVDTENNTVEYCGVDEFSQWTLGGKVPPPVPLSSTGIIIIIIALGLISFFGLRIKGLV